MTSTEQLLKGLPAVWPRNVAPDIHKMLQDGRKVVILDDDPTGTQTVADVPVLTIWTPERLGQELLSDAPGFFILTNSRSLGGADAAQLTRSVAKSLEAASRKTNRKFSVISRSDSTLRGHYSAETDALSEVLGPFDAVLVIPAFFPGGRLTLGGIHYAVDEGVAVPVAETPFARDASFGFGSSDLHAWVEEKTGGRVPAREVVGLPLDAIRRDGPEGVCNLLRTVRRGVVAVDAVTAGDLEVVACGALMAEHAGSALLYRTAASFVNARLGTPEPPLLDSTALGVGKGAGLTVVGSYVLKTTEQLHHLLATGVQGVELSVSALLEASTRKAEVNRAAEAVNRHMADGVSPVVYSSRELVIGDSVNEHLDINRRVSEGLVEVVRRLERVPSFLVAKGGITSSDLAIKALGVERAVIAGQVIAGVPVWRLDDSSRFPSLPFVVFPGNVGTEHDLTNVVKTFVEASL